MEAKHTPGPWRWEINESSKSLHLVGGKPMYDLTIIEPTRWGWDSATLMIRDTAHDGMNIMHKIHERRDWIEPFPGRSHHKDWCANVIHPDMRLISAAPELLEALKNTLDSLEYVQSAFPSIAGCGVRAERIKSARAAIAKATGNKP